MNKAQKKRHNQDMHALKINRAAWLAFSAAENERWQNAKVRELLEVVDNVWKALVESYETNKLCSVRVDFWDTALLPGLQEALNEDRFDGKGDFMPRLTPEERQRIEEELRRQESSDDPYPF